MSAFFRNRLFCVLVTILLCLYNLNALNSNDNDNDNNQNNNNEDNTIITDNESSMVSLQDSACIADTNDIITDYYQRIMYDPRIDDINQDDMSAMPPLLKCNGHTIWTSNNYVIYYTQFTDSMIAYDGNVNTNDNGMKYDGFGVFECKSNSYLSAMKLQPADDDNDDNLCIHPMNIYPDSYPGCSCSSKPIIYCLPFKDEDKCPQFQMAMKSMYTMNDDGNDPFDHNIENFYDCNCWYQSNDEGDVNNDERIFIDIDYDSVQCQQRLNEQRLNAQKENEELRAYSHDQQHKIRKYQQEQEREEEEEKEEEIELEKNREFSILWATLGFIIGVLALCIVVIYGFSNKYDKKMYLTSRKYLRSKHYGEVENKNLMESDDDDSDGDEYETETETATGSEYETETETETGTVTETETEYEDDTNTNIESESIQNYNPKTFGNTFNV